ncbi:MAG: hypothetical protein KJ737_17390 [Proteobacteria bacterium]|nr:hypothetical protein [Pseudomonadota bacterium]
MQNMMNDILKNVDAMKAFDFTKNLDIFKDMNASKIGLQILGFQKNAFNTTYNTLLKIQEQSEKIVDSFVTSNAAIPDQGRKFLDEWRQAFRNGQNEFKKSIDDSFVKVESFFSGEIESPKSKSNDDQQVKVSEPKKMESDLKRELSKSNLQADEPKKETNEKDKPIKDQVKKNK